MKEGVMIIPSDNEMALRIATVLRTVVADGNFCQVIDGTFIKIFVPTNTPRLFLESAIKQNVIDPRVVDYEVIE